MTGLPGTDTGPEIEDDPVGCHQARTDGYTPTCGRSDGDHCPACELCPGHHAHDCPERTLSVTTPQPGTKNLLHHLTEGRELPEGCDAWGIRAVRPDFRSRNDFRWPFPGNTATAPGPINKRNTDGCPSREGDGICLGHTWKGMASGGIPAATLLLCAYAAANVLGATESEQKFRVTECVVVDVVDGIRLVKEHGRSADLRSANLRYANLSYANLSYADLSYADLRSADLSYANLRYADLSSADLSYADLRYADLSYANLRYANLSYANLRYADLSYADLRSADLSYADLRSADLSYADLSSADLSSADLSSADLRSADLRSADLSYADLRYAIYANEYTICPTGVVVENGLLIKSATVKTPE